MLTYDFHDLTRENLKKYVDHVLHDICSHLSLTENCLLHYSLQLSIWEILVNIIDHNPQAASTHPTHITVLWTDSEIILRIVNKGGCFDWHKHLATGLPSPEQVRGRGLYIIKSISKHFSFDERGETAIIIFDR
ncbi:ATP-binding protein [Aneurinibacillus danicus]|jgi:anti-sigma regulatory factor (Ser/Thr protein kinase)|uniref:Histidine kinase/HSP90-like ATPase domain-containing protein n=1 Tax=Aneurinibacillus danicus TaxID=267746 RepID=A0A511V951_9BACL|nr:ATP-binding protein [Aneurinibacillus danicus]GEN35379.1 hypothetical protein ADA01nite_28390 [Aneurinibacillus danicus]